MERDIGGVVRTVVSASEAGEVSLLHCPGEIRGWAKGYDAYEIGCMDDVAALTAAG